ncbi:MAG: aminotransferase class V-fold PLP-dependent enzyme, partial [Gammaproteobacteria bacterium]|nr:aminotransferase class V-fold PLP-dependent enzyme [Gammaproteobacteria bacterium]
VDYFAWIGAQLSDTAGVATGESTTRAQHIRAAFNVLFAHETTLAAQLITGLQSIGGVTIRGITAPDALHRRVSTVSFTHARVAPSAIATALAKQNIFAWSGHNYALEVVAALGILESGGTVRIGAVHYNSLAEIDELLNALDGILS